jgi:hypothetical protein
VMQNDRPATPQPSSHRLLAWCSALLIGALGTWLLHRHQFASGFDLFPGPRGDTRQTAYICEHWYQALRGNAELLSPAIFYPVKGTLGYSDALLLLAAPYSVLRASGFDIFTALAVVAVAFNFLNFVAGFLLLFHVLRFRWLPSVAGAMFFAFNSPKLSEADHLQLQPVWLLAIGAASVIVFFRDARSLSAKRAFGLLLVAGLALDLQLLTGWYLGWFVIFWSGLFLAVAVCFPQAREVLRAAIALHWRPALAAAAVAAAGLLPFLAIYLPVMRETVAWPYRVALHYLPRVGSYLLMADGNFIWSRATQALLQAAGGGPDWGRRIGIGLVPTLTWLGLSILVVKAPTRRPFLTAAVVAVNLLILLTLQYHGHSLWRAIFEVVPGAKGIRSVPRFMIVAALPLSVAFAFAVDQAQRRVGRRVGLHAAVIGLVAFGVGEQFNRGDGNYYSIRAENTRLQQLAAKLPVHCRAFYVTARWPDNQSFPPFQNQQWMHDAMLVSVLRGVPTLNGRSSKSPPGWDLREVAAPGYEARVQEWAARHRLTGPICRLQIDD